MNLKSLRQQIGNHLDYSPELQNYKNQIDDLVNDAYLYLWSQKRWSFAQREQFLKVYPDMNFTREGTGATVVKGIRSVTFSAMERLIPQVWEGQVIEIQGYEYGISKVVSTSQLLLDIPFIGTTTQSDETWVIKHRYYDLPPDSIELLSMSHKDTPVPGSGIPAYGKLISIMPRREEEMNLRTDYAASYAEGYVWASSKFIPPAEKCLINNIVDRGVLFPLEGFQENTYLEVCWCFEKDGVRGALSEPATVFFPVDAEDTITYQFRINFVSWDDQVIVADAYNTLDGMPVQYEGFRKIVFWNANYNRATGERLGLPCWKEFNVAAGSTARNSATYLNTLSAQDTDAYIDIGILAQIDSGNKRYIEYDGQHNRVRPYPRIDGWDIAVTSAAGVGTTNRATLKDYLRELSIRYMYKPHALTLSTDSPELPYEMHQLIVYKALENIYLKVGNASMSEIYRRKIEKEVKMLEKRYVDHIDSLVQRGQFGVGAQRWEYDPTSLRKLN